MLERLILIGILIAIGLAFLKIGHHTKKAKTLVLIIIGLTIYFSAFELFSYEKFSLGSISGIFIALKLYFGWIWSVVVGVWDVGTDTVSFMGNAIKNYF